MIAPITSDPTFEPDIDSIRTGIQYFFKPGGRLQKAFQKEAQDYAARPQQIEMAGSIGEHFIDKKHLIIEAGTGVGKSFAYLAPAILYALETNTKVVISTHTINLQEQLMKKDIPFLKKALGIEFSAVLVKGRSNYLCRRRLDFAMRKAGDLFNAKDFQELEQIRDWANTTEDGSLQSMAEQPSHRLWEQICAEEGSCGPMKNHTRCFLGKARKQMQDAQILVVNHHLFFADLAIRMQEGGFLPEYGSVVFDEAHELENVASEHLGIRLSQYAFNYWIRRLYVPETGKGLLAVLGLDELKSQGIDLRNQVEDFLIRLAHWADMGDERGHLVLENPLPLDTTIPQRLRMLAAGLRTAVNRIEDDDFCSELKSLARRGEGIAETFTAFMNQALEDQVYWLEMAGKRRAYLVMNSAPIEIAPLLQKHLFSIIPSVVMTSATLSVNHELKYFQERIGLEETTAHCLGHVFNYERQMKILIPKNMPPPNSEAAFAEAVTEALPKYIRITDGSALVLFTSQRFMRKIEEQTRSTLEAEGYKLWVQGREHSRSHLLQHFKNEPRSILYGLSSFWAGIDIPGENLKNVIITRLPFSVPDQPLIQARMKRIKEKGGDAFRNYSLPEAILRFRQGVGRLIRTEYDEGIVVILDNRIYSKWYGKRFLASIPECPVERCDEI